MRRIQARRESRPEYGTCGIYVALEDVETKRQAKEAAAAAGISFAQYLWDSVRQRLARESQQAVAP